VSRHVRLMNLISKFELHCSNNLIDMIIELNSDVPLCAAYIASTTNLESFWKTMLDHLREVATRSASKIAKASTSKVVSFCAQIFVPAAIKAPYLHHCDTNFNLQNRRLQRNSRWSCISTDQNLHRRCISTDQHKGALMLNICHI
jgi:hypothetical protein